MYSAYRVACEYIGSTADEELKRVIVECKDSILESIPGGRAWRLRPRDFPEDFLLRGLRVELEHTSDPIIALEIVMDHGAEFLDESGKMMADYYQGLEKMEKELVNQWVK